MVAMSTSSMFSLIHRLLPMRLPLLEVESAIGLPYLPPVPWSAATPPAIDVRLCPPRWTHYSHGLALPQQCWVGGVAEDAVSPIWRSPAQSNRPVSDALLPETAWNDGFEFAPDALSVGRRSATENADFVVGRRCSSPRVKVAGQPLWAKGKTRRWKLRCSRERPVCCRLTGAY